MDMKILDISASKNWIFAVLISLFVLKGVFFALLLPAFQNPDEQVHYGTIQHWSEPEEKTWEIKEHKKGEYLINTEDIRTSNLPEETRESAAIIGFDEIKFQNQNTQNFENQETENSILENTWQRFVSVKPSMVSGTWSWYYLVSSWIERLCSGADIFTRMFAIRVFSVVLGILVVLLAYLTFRKINFSNLESLLLASLVAFQPMLTATAAQINIDIALIFSFSLFIFTGVWILNDGISWKKSLLLMLSALLGFFAKGPGIVLVASLIPLLGYPIWIRFGQQMKERINSLNMSPKTLWLSLIFAIIFVGTILWGIIPTSYISSITHASAVSKFDSPLTSLAAYFDKTIDIDAFCWSAISYWGNFGWLDTRIGDAAFNSIWTLEIIGLIGVILYFLPKTFLNKLGMTEVKEFLPEKKYIVFLLLLSLALQFAIRFYDWRVFDATSKILIGTPGRYFLPNIIAHFALLATGLGFFCRSRMQFQWLLKTLCVLMVLLSSYSFFDIILPRYYL